MQPREALFYQSDGVKVRCLLCPHQCVINEGATGICHVRRNSKGRLYTDIYGKISALNFDPIEKKPLYHYYPGSVILSLGSTGCNMHCKCCQNWQISQVKPADFSFHYKYEISELVQLAKSREENIGIAYTYNEPGIWIEYVLDLAHHIKAEGLKNVMVTNGFIEPEPLDELLTCVDAFNVDLKSFSDDFYRKVTGARLDPVLAALKKIKGAGKHLEITNLVIPTLNDNDEVFTSMVKWISNELGKETVIHLSRYHPMYKMDQETTPSETLRRLAGIAEAYLLFVYVGNIELGDYQHTRCPNCNSMVIKRFGYNIEIKSLDEKGCCLFCHKKIVTI
jgi:pyruvate formate lyase activating enzyme